MNSKPSWSVIGGKDRTNYVSYITAIPDVGAEPNLGASLITFIINLNNFYPHLSLIMPETIAEPIWLPNFGLNIYFPVLKLANELGNSKCKTSSPSLSSMGNLYSVISFILIFNSYLRGDSNFGGPWTVRLNLWSEILPVQSTKIIAISWVPIWESKVGFIVKPLSFY